MKGITPKIRKLCFCPNKQHSFETFMCSQLKQKSLKFENIIFKCDIYLSHETGSRQPEAGRAHECNTRTHTLTHTRTRTQTRTRARAHTHTHTHTRAHARTPKVLVLTWEMLSMRFACRNAKLPGRGVHSEKVREIKR